MGNGLISLVSFDASRGWPPIRTGGYKGAVLCFTDIYKFWVVQYCDFNSHVNIMKKTIGLDYSIE